MHSFLRPDRFGLVVAPLIAFAGAGTAYCQGVPITSLPGATIPLNLESVPLVQGGVTAKAPALAFGIPYTASACPASPLSTSQLCMNQAASPWSFQIYDGSTWVSMGQLDPTGHAYTSCVSAVGGGLLGCVKNISPTAHKFFTGIDTNGNVSISQPAFTDVSGTLASGQCLLPTSTTVGCIDSLVPAAHGFLTGITPSGTVTSGQPAFTDLSGMLASGQCPAPGLNAVGCVQDFTPNTHSFLTGLSSAGVFASGQPAFSDISGVMTSGQCPFPGVVSGGCVQSLASGSHFFITGITTGGIVTSAQPAFTDVAGTVSASQITSVSGSALPFPSSSVLGGVLAAAPVSNEFVSSINVSGAPVLTRPVCANLSDATASCSAPVGTSGHVLGYLDQNLIFTGSGIFSGTVQINNTGLTLTNAISGTILQVSNAVTRNSTVEIDAYTPAFGLSGSQLALTYASGTASALVAVPSGTTLGQISFDGWTGSSYQLGARIFSNTTTGWGLVNVGANLIFSTSLPNEGNPFTRWIMQDDGGFYAPSVASGDQGTGTINASGLYQQGIQVVDLSSLQTITGKTFNGSGNVFTNLPLSGLATISANTLLGNSTNSTTYISAINVPTCSATTSALSWTAGSGFGCTTLNTGSNAHDTISWSPGTLTSVVSSPNGFVKVVKASTVDNFEISALLFTGITANVSMFECGTSKTCASPTLIASGTITSAGIAVDAVVGSPAVAAGDYVAFELTSGTFTSVDISATSQIHQN